MFEKIVLHKVFLPVIYKKYCKRPINEERVLFADSKNKELPFSMRTIYRELKLRGYQVENWCVDFSEISLTGKLKYLIQFMKRYASSKCVFICDYFLPISSCSKRHETKVVQLWHACGIFKKFGYDVVDDLGNCQINLTKNIDLWTVSSPSCVPIYENACHLYKEQVQPLGISRTDLYFSEAYRRKCHDEFYQRYPDLKGKKLILWAPTFRGNAQAAKAMGIGEIQELQKRLENEWFVLIKIHPHLAKKYAVNNCDIQTEKLYPIIDILVTDYSSVIFDYSLFDKPFVIFAPDYNTYMNERGCYVDIERDFPCRVTTTVDELEFEIRQPNMDWEKMNMFQKTYMESCDGKSTPKILKYILGENDKKWKNFC